MKHSIGTLVLSGLCMLVLPAAAADALQADAKKAKEAAPDAGGDAAAKEGEEEDKTPRIFSFDLGMNGSYSKGVSSKSLYYQPFVDFYLKHKYVKFTGGISRYWNFQITNGEGKYETVNFTEPKLALSLYPHKVLEIYGEYRYSSGDKSHYYRGHKVTAGLNLDFEVVTLGCSANFKKTEYKFKSDDLYDKATTLDALINNYPPPQQIPRISLWYQSRLYAFKNLEQSKDIGVAPAFSWYMHKTTSLDLSYDHTENIFYPYNHDKGDVIFWNSKYYTNSGRIGIYSDPWDYISIIAGASVGMDSAKYLIATPDVGLTFNIMDFVKISGTYAPSYYKAPPPAFGTKIGPFHPFRVSKNFLKFYEIYALASLVKRRNANPYSNLQNIAKSYWNQAISFNVTYTY